MKKLSFILLLLAVCSFNIQVQAQSEAEMKAWQNFMTPSEMHK